MDSKESRDKADVTVAVCKCGRAVFLGVTSYLQASDKKELGELAANGYSISHMTAEDARRSDFGCQCFDTKPPADEQTQDMFAGRLIPRGE